MAESSKDMKQVPHDPGDADIQALYEYLTSTGLEDVAMTAWSALAASIPVVGGAASVIVEHVRRVRDTRMAEAVVYLTAGYRDLLTRLDRDYMRTEEFRVRFYRVVEEMAEARNEAKRAEFTGAGLHLGLAGQHRQEFDLFVSTLGRLEPIHLALLGGLARRPDQEPMQDNRRLIAAIAELTPNVDDAIRLRLYEDLHSMGLVDSPNVLVTEESETFRDPSVGLLTGFGSRFVAFVTDPR